MSGYYVYFILDPRTERFTKGDFEFNHAPFYVGKGTGKRYASIRDRSKWVKHKIQKLKSLGLKPAYSFIYCEDEKTAFDTETSFIESLGMKIDGKGPLLNVMPGGHGSFAYINKYVPNGMLNRKHRPETKALIGRLLSERISGENNPAKRPEVRRKISDALMGHSVSQETREKLRQANLGKRKIREASL